MVYSSMYIHVHNDMHLYCTCTQVLELLHVADTKMDLSENYTFSAEFNVTASMLFEDATLQPIQTIKKGASVRAIPNPKVG